MTTHLHHPECSAAAAPTRRALLAGGVAGVAGLALAGAGAPTVAAAGRLPWRSGVFSHNAPRAAAFQKARGVPLDVIAVFPTRTDARALQSTWWMSSSAIPKGFRGTLAVGLPLFPNNGSLAAAAAGKYDSLWRTMGRLIASKYPTAYVRPGWEFNITNWPWRATPENASTWIKAFQRQSVALKRGGPRLRVVWNVNEGVGNSLRDATMAWPGVRYVDVVGIDAYDWHPVYTPAGWNEHRTRFQGWDYWADFARRKGKTFAVPEWGVMPGSSASGGDNPYFIDAVMGWMRSNSRIMEFEAYFDETQSYCSCALSMNPKAQAAYRRHVLALAGR